MWPRGVAMELRGDAEEEEGEESRHTNRHTGTEKYTHVYIYD